MSTEMRMATLAGRPTPPRISPRLEVRRRLIALLELFADAPRKPAAIYALTRREPRCQLPDEKQRAIIHQAIREGLISRERIIRYRASQLLDDFTQFPDEASPRDVLYVRLMLEEAKAIHAQTVAHALPTPANRAEAVRETREAIAIAELQCVSLLPQHPLPMGATPR